MGISWCYRGAHSQQRLPVCLHRPYYSIALGLRTKAKYHAESATILTSTKNSTIIEHKEKQAAKEGAMSTRKRQKSSAKLTHAIVGKNLSPREDHHERDDEGVAQRERQ